MNVAYCDCRTPRCSRSNEIEKPSNRRLPPPRMTGALAPAEDDRRDDHGELVDEPCRQRLADDVGSAHDMDVLATGGFRGSLDRLLHSGDERDAPPSGSSSGRCVTMKNG